MLHKEVRELALWGASETSKSVSGLSVLLVLTLKYGYSGG
jgi:hypothetical protein